MTETLATEEHGEDIATLVQVRDVQTPFGVIRQFSTTSDYVDCECDADYIHARSDMPAEPAPDYVICDRCGTHFEDSPDSRGDEVFDIGLPITRESLEFH